jgi:hypothetical protein
MRDTESLARLKKNPMQKQENNTKLASVVIKLGHNENPPLHLPIGTDSVNNYKIYAQKLTQDVNDWMKDSLSTDYVSN